MNKISKITDSVETKKKIPKTENTKQTLILEGITPELLHNIEDPTLYLNDARKLAKTTKEGFRTLFDLDVQYKEKVFEKIMKDPNFLLKDEEEFTIDELKNYVNECLLKLVKLAEFTFEDFKDFKKLVSFFEIAGLINASLGTKVAVHYGLFCKSI